MGALEVGNTQQQQDYRHPVEINLVSIIIILLDQVDKNLSRVCGRIPKLLWYQNPLRIDLRVILVLVSVPVLVPILMRLRVPLPEHR